MILIAADLLSLDVKAKIELHLVGLKLAKGTFPTPMGVIKVNHVKEADGTIKSTVDVPKGIKVLCK